MILLPLTLLLVASETLHTQKSIVLFWKISGWGTMASQGDIPATILSNWCFYEHINFVKACTTGTFEDLGTHLIQYMYIIIIDIAELLMALKCM